MASKDPMALKYRSTAEGRAAIPIIEEDEPNTARLIVLFEAVGKTSEDVIDFLEENDQGVGMDVINHVAALRDIFESSEYIIRHIGDLVKHLLRQGWIEEF